MEDNIVVSRYYVLKQTGILYSKRILQITTQSVILDTLPLNANNREIIEWKYFKDCVPAELKENQLEDEDPVATNEFYLAYTNQEKVCQMKLSCKERLNLIADILRCYDQYRERTSYSFEKEIPTIDALRILSPNSPGTTYSVTLKIYRAFIEINHKKLNQGESDETVYEKFEIADPPPLSMPYNEPQKIIIQYNCIEKFERTSMGMAIVTKDTLKYYNLVFMDMERTHKIVERIRENAKKHLLMNIPFVPLDKADTSQTRKFAPEELKYLFFALPVYKLLPTGQLMPIIIAPTELEFYEIDPETLALNEKIQMQGCYRLVRFGKDFAGFQFILKHLEVVTYITPPNQRDIIVTTLVHIMKIQRVERSNLTVHEFIPSSFPPINLEVKAWPAGEPDKDYIVALLRSMCDPTNDTQFYYTIREFNLYPSISNYADHDPLPLEFMFLLFKKYAPIVTTPEFNSFASTFNKYVKLRLNLKFLHRPPHISSEQIDPVLSETEHRYEIEQLEKELTAKTVNFKYAEDDSKPLLELTPITFPEIASKVQELLKALTTLMTSRPYFRDLASSKQQKKFYAVIFEAIVQLLDSEWPSLAIYASSFLHSFVKFPVDGESKYEQQNIKFMVTEINVLKKISELLARRVLVQASRSYLQEDPHVVNICATLRVLKAVLYDRKASVASEDLEIVITYLRMPYYFAIINFLTRYQSFTSSYKASLLFNSLILNVDTKEKFKQLQDNILNHSSLILFYISAALASPSTQQRELSVILLSHVFKENASACGLAVRIFPKPLFRKVGTKEVDLSKWTLHHWEEFFAIARKNFNTASEQWDEASRDELISKLQKADREVMETHRYLKLEDIPHLFEPSGSILCERLIEIRWNHEEFEMEYDILNNKIFVWKYYLTSLIHDGESPALTVPIQDSPKFWSQLNIRFISSTELREQLIILKTMVLVYKNYYSDIKDLTTISYWSKTLVSPEYKECRYLILQLIYTAITVDDQQTARINLKRFIETQGVKKLTDILAGLHFAENHNKIYTEEFVKQRQEYYRTHPEEEMLYNYTNLKLEKQAYTNSLKKACTVNFIIRIYGVVFQKRIKDDLLLYPLPKAKGQILERDPISVMLNMLLLNDDETRKETLEYLLKNLSDRFCYKALAFDTPLYEYLIINLTEKTANLVGQLLICFYKHLREDLGDSVGKVLNEYISTTFESLNPQTVEVAQKTFPILKYMPKHLFWILINKGPEDFEKVLFSEKYESPELVWKREMLEYLQQTINSKIQDYRTDLINYSDNVEVHTSEAMPKFKAEFGSFVFANLQVSFFFLFVLTLTQIYLSLGGVDMWSLLSENMGSSVTEDLQNRHEGGV